MRIAGVDYSMTSPAVCVHIGDQWDIMNCKFFYLNKTKKLAKKFLSGMICGKLLPGEFSHECERYNHVAEWTIKHLYGMDHVSIEGYAYGATGRVFQIAENTGLLKHKLWELDIPYNIYTPTHIKKFATDYGYAKKPIMYEAWMKETDLDIHNLMTPKRKEVSNPITDIVDAYFICKKLFCDLNGLV